MLNVHPASSYAFTHRQISLVCQQKRARLAFSFPQPPMGCFLMSLEVFDGDHPFGSLLEVRETGSLTFNGDVILRQIEHAGNVLEVGGSAE